MQEMPVLRAREHALLGEKKSLKAAKLRARREKEEKVWSRKAHCKRLREVSLCMSAISFTSCDWGKRGYCHYKMQVKPLHKAQYSILVFQRFTPVFGSFV